MDIRDIKEECNLLIDEVMRLQKIDRDLDLEIRKLQEEIMEQNICSTTAGDEADFHEEPKELLEPENTVIPEPREEPVKPERAEQIFLPNENENKGRGIMLAVAVATVLLLCCMGKGVI